MPRFPTIPTDFAFSWAICPRVPTTSTKEATFWALRETDVLEFPVVAMIGIVLLSCWDTPPE